MLCFAIGVDHVASAPQRSQHATCVCVEAFYATNPSQWKIMFDIKINGNKDV